MHILSDLALTRNKGDAGNSFGVVVVVTKINLKVFWSAINLAKNRNKGQKIVLGF